MDSPDFHSIELRGHSDSVRCVVFSPSGQLIASCSSDNTVRLWDAKAGKQVAVFRGHTDIVWCVTFSPDGATLASASKDNTVKLWDVASRAEIATLSEHTSYVYYITFSPDGTLIASASHDNTVRIWDSESKACVRIIDKGHTSWVLSVTFSPDSKILASGSVDMTARLWDVGSGACLATLKGHTGSVFSVAFSPAGDQIATGSKDRTVMLWDAATKTPIATLQGHSNEVNSVEFSSPNGKYLASASDDKTIRLWDVASRSHLSTLTGHLKRVYTAVFSPDGSQLASASMDHTIRLWTPVSRPTLFSQTNLSPPDQDDVPSLSSNPLDLKNDITDFISLTNSVHIGLGGFGDVFSGSHEHHGKVALKRPHKLFDNSSSRRFLREVDLWCSVSHRYILPCFGMCKFEPYIYVVSPFIENGDLHSCMSKGIPFNSSKILYEVAEALAHLHHRGIVHGDVKAQNVLLADDGSALLCDFGLAKALDSMVTSTESKGTGSVRWMAPELLRNGGRSMASDVYSFGITIAEVLSGQAPYPDIPDNIAVAMHVLLDGGRPPRTPLGSYDRQSHSLLWETAEKCWVNDSKDRPYMAQVLGMLFPLARVKV